MVKVALVPSATLGVKTNVTVPVMAQGIDLEERRLAYSYEGSLPQNGVTFSVKFGKDSVFRVIDGSPALRHWQVGPAGAHLRLLTGHELPQDRRVSLRYYPGGFGSIGDIPPR